jgi:ATP-dependent Clp endopeptidase proteolytic subunit ClpP
MTRSRLIDISNRPEKAHSARPTAAVVEGRTDWYRIVNAGGSGNAEVFVYDEIGYFGVAASDFVAALKSLGAQPIDMHINSPGGDVWDGMAIYNAVQQHPAAVTCYVDGLAASAASFIACAGDRLVMAKSATMMIHDALTITIGNAADLRAEADLLDKISDQIAGIYADKSGRPAADMRTAMQAETWFNADEAVAAGIADSIAESTRQSPAAKWDLSIFAYAGREQAPAPTAHVAGPSEAPPDAKQGEPPVDPAPAWDWEAIRNSLREAVK